MLRNIGFSTKKTRRKWVFEFGQLFRVSCTGEAAASGVLGKAQFKEKLLETKQEESHHSLVKYFGSSDIGKTLRVLLTE